MPNYIRTFRPGGTFFLTLVTERRAPIFAEETARELLRQSIERCQSLHPFAVDAMVLLPDHLHLLMTLPIGDTDFSTRTRNIKSVFTRAYLRTDGAEQARSSSRIRQRSRAVWQKRFWEHTIRDADDLRRHFDYVHYNPVKHKYASCPHAWPHSSFHRFVSENRYEITWCCSCSGIVQSKLMTFDDIADSVGE